MTHNIDPARLGGKENTVVDDVGRTPDEVIVEDKLLSKERAAEVLATIDIMNLQPGVKSLSDDRQNLSVVQIRVSNDTRDKLRSIAESRSMSVPTLSRKVLEEFVEHELSG